MEVTKVLKTAVLIIVFCACGSSEPQKPWKPEMCNTLQRPRVSRAYVLYCMSVQHYTSHCIAGQESGSPMEIIAAGAKSAYLEVLDCSWHPGKNPRDKE